MSRSRILMLGDIGIDTVWPIMEFPSPGRDSLVDTVKVEVGGAVVNSAIVLDRLGQGVSLLGCVGADVWADKIGKELSHTQIDCSHVQVSSGAATALTFIIATTDGERTMFSHRGANVQLAPDHIEERAFENASMLHISGYALLEAPQKNAMWRAVELAKKHNVPISVDTGLEPAIMNPKDMCRLLETVTICVSGPEEISELLGSKSPEEAADKLITSGVSLAAIKLGKEGSITADSSGQFVCPPFSVEAVDTTGAGDSFSAGILYGWLNKMDLLMTTILASALGALAASVYGAGFSLPDKQRVLNFMKSSRSLAEERLQEGIKEVISQLEVE